MTMFLSSFVMKGSGNELGLLVYAFSALLLMTSYIQYSVTPCHAVSVSDPQFESLVEVVNIIDGLVDLFFVRRCEFNRASPSC